MCGKFTVMVSWAEMVDLAPPLSILGDRDQQAALRVMANVPLIVWDGTQRRRRILTARWGFPHPKDWRRPQPIHARAETIEITNAFADAFLDGQRGIVQVRTFNEAPDIDGPTIQHTITPDMHALGIAFVWRKFDVGAAEPLYAACMVTVPANKLIAGLPTDRMPAVLAYDDWKIWLGEESASLDRIKACLKTVEGVDWRMEREERKKPTVREPQGR
jgi:putative SOS response-associated peptidase YedK